MGECRRPAPPPSLRPPLPSGGSPEVTVRVTAPPPQLAPASGAPTGAPKLQPPRAQSHFAASGGHLAPGTHSPASRAVQRLRPGEKERRASQESPAHTSAKGANRRPLRQAMDPPTRDTPTNQEERLAGGANQKLPECASRGKRTAPERGARRRGHGRDPKSDRQGVRPMARLGGRPGAGSPRDPGEWAALCTRHE